jgi:hypothetical protein
MNLGASFGAEPLTDIEIARLKNEMMDEAVAGSHRPGSLFREPWLIHSN